VLPPGARVDFHPASPQPLRSASPSRKRRTGCASPCDRRRGGAHTARRSARHFSGASRSIALPRRARAALLRSGWQRPVEIREPRILSPGRPADASATAAVGPPARRTSSSADRYPPGGPSRLLRLPQSDLAPHRRARVRGAALPAYDRPGVLTTPATASILTGRDPLGHGAVLRRRSPRRYPDPRGGTARERLPHRRIRDQRQRRRVASASAAASTSTSICPRIRRGPPCTSPPTSSTAARCRGSVRTTGGPFPLPPRDRSTCPYRPPARLLERFRPPGPTPPVATIAEPVRAMTADPKLQTPENIEYLTALYDEIAFVGREHRPAHAGASKSWHVRRDPDRANRRPWRGAP
jgi:hypothetical protein